jgi:membrane-associated phospholipid phosphatase
MDARGDNTAMLVARAVSEIFAPGILVVVVLLIVGWHSDGASGVSWALMAAAFCSLIPYAIVLRGVRRGHWSDHHIKVRAQRLVPLLVAIASVVTGVAVLSSFPDAPRELLALQIAMLAGLGVGLVITRWWKVSIHTAVVSGVVTVLVLTYGASMTAATPLVALTAWSRVRLGDHTAPQTVVGALFGAVVAAAIFPVLI